MSFWNNSCAFLLCGLFMIPTQGGGTVSEHHLYRKTTGSESFLFNWRLERGEEIRLITDFQQERDVTRINSELATRSWSVKDPSNNTDMSVSRRQNQLIMRGLFKGKKLEKVVTINDSPWYQALSISLRQFTNPNNTGREFWSIRPDTLDVHRLEVILAGEEAIDLDGTATPAIKLKIQLPGFKAMLWSCHYWLRKTDGLFIRYEGPSGPPGWPDTIVELINYQSRAEQGRQQPPPLQQVQ